MKRILVLIVALIVSIPLAIGIIAGMAYYTTTESSVPTPRAKVMSEEITPAAYTWHEPVFGGMMYRDFESTEAASIPSAGSLENPYLLLEAPSGYDTTVEYLSGDEVIWTGTPGEAQNYKFTDNGTYRVRLTCETEASDYRGHGNFEFLCEFRVAVEPRMEISNEWVNQGDTVAIKVFNLKADQTVAAETDFGEVHFIPSDEGTVTGYLPIGHAREAGNIAYNVKVWLDDHSYEWETSIRVIEGNFKVENIVVAAEDAEVPEEGREVSNVGQAPPEDYSEYHELIRSLFEEYDEEMYWEGVFEMPIKGTITVDYGLITYSTGSSRQLQQSGIGITADEDTPVVAPNNGRVVFIEEMRDAGLSMVIEHGGGLKSLFFFLGETDLQVGDMVTTGQRIATVGRGGFSDDAKVYYEVRVGYETVNPTMVFDGTSGLYYFDKKTGTEG